MRAEDVTDALQLRGIHPAWLKVSPTEFGLNVRLDGAPGTCSVDIDETGDRLFIVLDDDWPIDVPLAGDIVQGLWQWLSPALLGRYAELQVGNAVRTSRAMGLRQEGGNWSLLIVEKGMVRQRVLRINRIWSPYN